jgi:hypothetical protein
MPVNAYDATGISEKITAKIILFIGFRVDRCSDTVYVRIDRSVVQHGFLGTAFYGYESTAANLFSIGP